MRPCARGSPTAPLNTTHVPPWPTIFLPCSARSHPSDSGPV